MSDPSGPYQEDPDSEFYMEITSLSPSEVTTSSRAQKRPWQLMLVMAAFLLVLALVLTHLPSQRALLARTSPTVTIVSNSSVILLPTSTPRGVLGAVPANCPPGNPVVGFSSAYAPGVSIDTLAIWMVGFSGVNATLHLQQSPATPLGWEHKLLLVVASTLTGSITMQIQPVISDLGTGEPLLSLAGTNLTTASLTFHPGTAPVSSPGGWSTWPLNVFIPSSGCYYLGFEYGGREISGTFFAAGL